MSCKKAIATAQAPAAIGPYSQAVATTGLLFASGNLPVDPATSTMVDGDITARTHQVLKNLTAVAEAGGCSLNDAVKVTVFMTDLADFKAMNAVYAEYFAEPYPARSAVQVAALPLGSNIEIEAIFACKA
ncbi:MAG: Rid family detoxifying hydrolase [Pseudomonadota bacterium]